MAELSRIFMYISAFGLSDLFVRQYVTSLQTRLMYYIVIGLIGIYLSRGHE